MKQSLNIFNYTVRNQAEGETDIYIDGEIMDSPTLEIVREWWGDETSVSYKSLRDQITQSDSKRFNVYINSPGGHVGDAMAIHDLFVELQSKGIVINTHIRGICASAATYIAMSSKNSSISENSWFMIHNVSGVIWGDVNVIENYARMMRKFNDRITNFYSKRTGLSETVVGNLMNKETWLTAEEAKEKGFINSVTATADFTNAIPEEKWFFQNREVLTCYNSFTKKNDQMDLKKLETVFNNGIAKILNAVGAKDKSEDKALKDAVNEHFTELSNSIKELLPTEESIATMVNKAIDARTEDDAAAIEEAVKEGTKNFVDKDALKNQLDAFAADITKDLGNSSGKESNGGKKSAINPKNRFAGRVWFNEEK